MPCYVFFAWNLVEKYNADRPDHTNHTEAIILKPLASLKFGIN
jgi:hypothetical protein